MKAANKIIVWLVVTSLLLVLGMIISLSTFRQIEEAAGVRRHTYSVINNALGFLSALKDAETGQRGYLLTGDETYLEPYLRERDRITGHLNELDKQTLLGAAKLHLSAIAPMIAAKLAEMAQAIDLRRHGDLPGALALVSSGQGKRLMDSIRVEMHAFIELEESLLAQREIEFQSDMRRMFSLIVVASLLALFFALAFAWLIHRQARQRLKDLVHLETKHLLTIQEAMNSQLQQAYVTLIESQENLDVTLNSIGDAVLATDSEARVTRLNPVAEQLTGWTQDEAIGRPVSDVFHIVNKVSRQDSTIPVLDVLAHGTLQGLANHTVLIARDGREYDIADSCAPIRDRNKQVVGAVLVFRNVTEEYALQQSLNDSATLVHTLLNTIADGVITFLARGGAIETVNPAAEQMFGYSAEELAGRKFSLLVPELDQGQNNGSLEYYSASDTARAVGLGREVVGRRKDGSIFPLEIVVSQMVLGDQRFFTGILRDISARKQAEAALLKAGALQNAIFKSANFSCIATDAKGVIQIFNVGAECMLGYTAAEVMNKITPAEISDPQEVIVRAQTLSVELERPIAPGFEALIFKASRGIEDIYELTYIRKDGSRLPALVSVTALRDEKNDIIGYLLIGTDNTARLRIESERALLEHALLDKNTELERATFVAEKANRAKTDFLSNMSHELRTPLNAILGFAQLVESGSSPLNPSQKRSIDQILKAGWYLLELINEILDLALIESGKVTLSRESVSLVEVMLECRAMIEPQAYKRGIGMSFPRFETPCFVSADRMRVKQVLINLLYNAIKYNKPEGLVFVECTQGTSNSLRISVRDTGAGLTAEQLGQLFQPFNRLGKESSAEEGTGIGLMVSKRLVELMGGASGRIAWSGWAVCSGSN
ncbi:PAS domain S-box protein [Propionivibrio sp.]|uniref:PAS domain S-box protein n=1 Tax=Propionivibrio sp. TaxID=2212460 RepID=UPI00260AA262|nr:PAS domain S-box protein [Propionivibrio sp.]